jgi:drug/metabolite transporter (DMT)-like permease
VKAAGRSVNGVESEATSCARKLHSARQKQATAALVGAALIFGTTFVTVKDAIVGVPVVAFLAARFAVGTLAMVPFTIRRTRTPGLLSAGISAGAALLLAYAAQTEGLRLVDESTSAFITYLLVIFVPLIVAGTTRRRPSRSTVVGVVASAIGLFLLTGAHGHGVGRGEALTLLCALGFATHIVLLDRVSEHHDPVLLNAVQLGVVAVGAGTYGLIVGSSFHFSAHVWLAVVYLGVMASATAFFLQTWAQRHVGPTRAALLLMLEPVFAAVLAVALGRGLTVPGIAGALLILIGIAPRPAPRPAQRHDT